MGHLLTGCEQPIPFPYLVLLPMGFTKPRISRSVLVRSYRTVSPLPPRIAPGVGGLLSAALSVGFPRLVVNQHGALVEFGLSSISDETATPRTSRIGPYSTRKLEVGQAIRGFIGCNYNTGTGYRELVGYHKRHGKTRPCQEGYGHT